MKFPEYPKKIQKMNQIYSLLTESKAKKRKQFAVLIDPDKTGGKELLELIAIAEEARADFYFVGGSLLTNDSLDSCVQTLKKNSSIPVVLFPGNTMQINQHADAILFLSLISGRNAEMLIGKHVIAAPFLKNSKLEILSTAYMLIESGKPTAVSYMSNTTPIPHDKNDIAICTAIAGEMLGFKLVFMDGGSGAQKPIDASMIADVSRNISVPLIIGGGIRTPEKALENCKAGADVIVVGNSIESDPKLILRISEAIHSV
jgi:phosphoglycerol geranylgeranyltransferase